MRLVAFLLFCDLVGGLHAQSLQLGVAPVTHFALDPDFETRKNAWGFGAVAFNGDIIVANRNVTLEIGMAKSGIGIDFSRQAFASGWAGIRHSWLLGARWKGGVGLSAAYNRWRRLEPAGEWRPNAAAGLSFDLQYFIGDRLALGATYRPTFLRISDRNTQAYEHLFAVGLRYIWQRER